MATRFSSLLDFFSWLRSLLFVEHPDLFSYSSTSSMNSFTFVCLFFVEWRDTLYVSRFVLGGSTYARSLLAYQISPVWDIFYPSRISKRLFNIDKDRRQIVEGARLYLPQINKYTNYFGYIYI